MATHFSFLAWRIPRTEEPGDYSPQGRRVGHHLSNRARTHKGIRRTLLAPANILCFFKEKINYISIYSGFPGGTSGKEPACQCRRPKRCLRSRPKVRSLGQEDPLEKEMATRSSILAWKIP